MFFVLCCFELVIIKMSVISVSDQCLIVLFLTLTTHTDTKCRAVGMVFYGVTSKTSRDLELVCNSGGSVDLKNRPMSG